MEHHNIAEPIFYQLLEYVVAPLGLLVLTYYVKAANIPENMEQLVIEDNTEENILIVSYSCILFFLSLCAHPIAPCKCINEQNTALIITISGLVLIFFYKNPSLKRNSFLKQSFKWAWVGMLTILTWLIISSNMKAHKYHLSFSAIPETLMDIIKLFCNNPLNVVFLLLIFTILFYLYLAHDNPFRASIDSSQNNKSPADINFIDRWELKKIAQNIRIKYYSRISANNLLSEYYKYKKKYDKALIYIDRALKIAYESNYPEPMLQPLRRIKISLHLLLKQDDFAKAEAEKVNNLIPVNGEYDQEDIDLWKKKISEIFTALKNPNI